jgi:hypothetical protein
MRKTSDALEILRQHTGIDPKTAPQFRAIARESHIGQMIYDARTAAGLTQRSLQI